MIFFSRKNICTIVLFGWEEQNEHLFGIFNDTRDSGDMEEKVGKDEHSTLTRKENRFRQAYAFPRRSMGTREKKGDDMVKKVGGGRSGHSTSNAQQ